MSITRLQQARQMYALGQRVAKTLDGSRPGYRGDDAARSSEGTSGGRADPGNAGRGDTRGDIGNDRYSGAENKASNLQTYNHNIATGQADKNPYGPVPLNKREQVLQNFYNTRPKVNIPNFGLTGMFLNLFNKGVNSPIQKFSDFGAKKNRAFFEDVIRAGKIPGLDFGTVAEMSPEQLENAYGSYMSNRMSGATDAYGNPIGNQGGEGIQTIPLQYGMSSDNSDEVEGIETIASDPFTSRYLQNQPDDIREAIESRMQNYYTV
tara:strand:- start:12 stop:803 length:792 start_codon:yes stop_codon:yes gene_type:complete